MKSLSSRVPPAAAREGSSVDGPQRPVECGARRGVAFSARRPLGLDALGHAAYRPHPAGQLARRRHVGDARALAPGREVSRRLTRRLSCITAIWPPLRAAAPRCPAAWWPASLAFGRVLRARRRCPCRWREDSRRWPSGRAPPGCSGAPTATSPGRASKPSLGLRRRGCRLLRARMWAAAGARG